MFVYCYDSDDNDTVQQLSSTTTPTSTVNCSPRWIVYPSSRAFHALVNRAATQQQCLEECAADYRCVVVEWDKANTYRKCWIHDMHRLRRHHPLVTQFEIVRRCNPLTGKRRVQAFLTELFCSINCYLFYSSLIEYNAFSGSV